MDRLLGNADLVVQLVGHLAWPVTLLILLIIFHRQVASLLRRVRKIGSGERFAEFLTSEVTERIGKPVDASTVTQETITWDDYLDAIEQWSVCAGFALNSLHLLARGYPEADIGMKETLDKLEKQFKSLIETLEEGRPSSTMLPVLHDLRSRIRLITSLAHE